MTTQPDLMLVADGCPTCADYLNRRFDVIGPHIQTKAEDEDRPLHLVHLEFIRAAHARHLELGPTALLVCRTCGCTDDRACPGGCAWYNDELCSRCWLEQTRVLRRAVLIYSIAANSWADAVEATIDGGDPA